MPSPLGSLFSTIDSAKRKVMDALMNPGATLENLVAEKNADAGAHLDDLRHMPMPGQFPQPGGNAAKERVLTALAEGYNPGGIFVGARAKGIDNIALAYAMKDARKGRKPEEIWQERGWGKGPDGFWRSEIADTQAQPLMIPGGENQLFWNAQGGLGGPLRDSFDHPEFKKAYPDIWANSTADLSVHNFQDKKFAEGGFSRFAGDAPGGDIRMEAGSTSALRKGVLHELQHAVQSKEGFMQGSSPTNFLRRLPPAKNSAEELRNYRTALGLYYRGAGEAEARLVEGRANYTPDMRRGWYPWDPEYFSTRTGVDIPELLSPVGRPLFPAKP